MDFNRLGDYLYGNRVAIASGLALLVTAAIKTAPVPQSVFGKWLYDFGHQVFNISNTRNTAGPAEIPKAK
jgi:hypothetical protein